MAGKSRAGTAELTAIQPSRGKLAKKKQGKELGQGWARSR